MLDNANLYTRFEYDGAGRLIHTYKEKLSIGEFKSSQYVYNYGAPQYASAPLNTTYYKNNCPLYYNGSGVTVNYPAGAYNSFLSQADANAKSYLLAATVITPMSMAPAPALPSSRGRVE